MKAVIVNGQVTVRDDVLLPVFAGQPIRFEPEDKPRFVPISVESWNAEFSTGMPDVTARFHRTAESNGTFAFEQSDWSNLLLTG